MGCCDDKKKRPEDADEVRRLVSEGYARVVRDAGSSCCAGGASAAEDVSRLIGYSDEELAELPEGANLGLGCGNPTAIASLRPGETVVDLGAGAGIDAFLAAKHVGAQGRVIGIDMTDDMLERARANALAVGAENVEFRKGLIEELPVEDGCADVIISNCVINLSPEKPKVFAEAFRVLRPGGRLMVSDVVLERPLPEAVLQSVDAYVGCVGGASLRADYLAAIENAGFTDVRVLTESSFGDKVCASDSPLQDAIKEFGANVEEVREFLPHVSSLGLVATKPSTS